jgi:hypothetical protein
MITFRALRVDGHDFGTPMSVTTTVLHQKGHLVASINGVAHGFQKMWRDTHPWAYLHIASQNMGPALVMERRENGREFDKLHKACTEDNASIQQVDPRRCGVELHLIPSRARRNVAATGATHFVNVFFGYVVPHSTLRRIEMRRVAVVADFDETLAHCFVRRHTRRPGTTGRRPCRWRSSTWGCRGCRRAGTNPSVCACLLSAVCCLLSAV